MKTLRIILGILLAFIAINAFGGGYYALAGAEGVPTEWLHGSPFTSYFFPGLFLFTVIGGACLAGAIAVFRNSAYAHKLAFACSALLLAWIIIQVAVIGHVSWMQPAIFLSAIVILILALFLRKKQKY